jgi:predicted phage terminase large subunit-like protein
MDSAALTSELGFTDEELRILLANLDSLTVDEITEVNKMVDELKARDDRNGRQNDLVAFCVHMMPTYLVGRHHRRLANLLMDIESGRKDRICVSVPPRHGKSQMVSIFYAAWYLGRNPGHKVMLVSHTTDLAVDFGRKVRNIISSPEFKEVFPDVDLAADSKSAGRWSTNYGGEFFAAGVGSALAGRGAHMLLVDDPHSEQDILNGNFEVFAKAYEWFAFGARTRLMPGGKIAIVHCMVGDTRVLMADGTETELKDVKPGDMVASYDNGALVSREVLNWINQGPDQVYTLRMSEGNFVRANERHPFLVDRDGVQTWVKVKDLKPGDAIVSLTGATSSPDRAAQAVNAQTASPGSATTGKTRIARAAQWGTTVSGRAWDAVKMGVVNAPQRMACAIDTAVRPRTTDERPMEFRIAPPAGGMPTSNSNMASTPPTIHGCSRAKMESAPYVAWGPMRLPYPPRGQRVIHSLLTTATKAAKSARFCAISAISWFIAGKPPTPSNELFSTSNIISVTPDTVEDVFDIEVEGTHNFIANGLCSSNTRWHLDDLIGRVTRDMVKNEQADQYEVFEFPAILETDIVTPEGKTETQETPLWPEFFDLTALHRTKASMPLFQWSAQFQQNPTSEEAAIVKRDWWRIWTRDNPPQCEFIISSLDSAAEKHNRADYTSLTTWGVFFNDETSQHELILLNAIKDRLEFPELKAMCLAHYEEWEPDAFIVEKKSSGTAVYQELRRMGIAVSEYTPHRGSGDKYARLNAVADMISSGLVWVPETRWADDLVDEIASFPYGSNDDQVDSSVMALTRFRQGGFIRLESDLKDDPTPQYQGRREYY